MKKWYLSKTIWLNIIAVAIYFGTSLMDSNILGENGLVFVTSATAVLNIILRFFTNESLESINK